MKIYLVRHGETDWNKEGRLQGCRDIPMNQHGILQMEQVGVYMSDCGCQIDAIISSPLQRARMSAEIIASRIGYEVDGIAVEPLFVERSFGNAEGLVWTAGMCLDDGIYGEESVEELCRRAATGIERYTAVETGNILIVAHGAIIKALIAALTKGEIAYADGSVVIGQGSILCVEYKNGKYVLQQGNIY